MSHLPCDVACGCHLHQSHVQGSCVCPVTQGSHAMVQYGVVTAAYSSSSNNNVGISLSPPKLSTLIKNHASVATESNTRASKCVIPWQVQPEVQGGLPQVRGADACMARNHLACIVGCSSDYVTLRVLPCTPCRCHGATAQTTYMSELQPLQRVLCNRGSHAAPSDSSGCDATSVHACQRIKM